MGATDSVKAGYDTTRIVGGPTAEQVRAQQEAAATSYLTRTGNTDLLDVLGLNGVDREPGRCRGCGRALPIAAVQESTRVRYLGYCERRACRAARRAAIA